MEFVKVRMPGVHSGLEAFVLLFENRKHFVEFLVKFVVLHFDLLVFPLQAFDSLD